MIDALRRAATRWSRRWSGAPELTVWHHRAYRLPAPSGVPMNPRRADDALTTALDHGWVGNAQLREPDELPMSEAVRVHSAAYLSSLDQAETIGAILSLDPDRLSVSAWMETWRSACGGTVAAAQQVARSGGRAVNLLGGFHHATPDAGRGFCGLNDVAIAIARLRADGWTEPVLVIDLDAHPPDGIVACAGDDAALTVLSVSAESAWTLPAAGSARVVDLRVPTGAADEAYLAAVDEALTELPDAGIVFYLAGADPFVDDALGALAVTEAGLRERDRRVMDAVGRRPLVILPAGGYHPQSWRILAGTIACASGVRERLSATYDPVARRMQVVAKNVVSPQLEADPWLTDEDLLGGLGRATRSEPRFLGFYTRHGLEAALTAYGYLDTLRRLGFGGLEVAIDPRPPAPDRLAISAMVGGQRAVLVDLAASVRVIAGFRCLFVDWLELRDPRGAFSPDRPVLPGQAQPGLGMATETMQLLARAAERLQLAGVAFVAAHYHVAWIARARFTAVHPEDRGRFRAFARVLSDVPLSEASRRLETSGLHTEDGEIARWAPIEVVAPVSDALRAALENEEPRAIAAEQAWMERLLTLRDPASHGDTSQPGSPEYTDPGITG